MLTKRIIPCLDVKNGRTVKGVNFVDLRDAGDPVELGMRYAGAGADELVFLDITATIEARDTLVDLVRRVAANIISRLPWVVALQTNAMCPLFWILAQTRSRSILRLYGIRA